MKYPCVTQHDITDCGAACLLTCLIRYGYNIPISQIRQYADTDKNGTSAYGIIKAAKKIGFIANGVKICTEDLTNTELPVPAIAHVIIDGIWQHYVVIHEINKEHIIVADPSAGIVKYNPDDFFKIWNGVVILLEPTNRISDNKKYRNSLLCFLDILKPQKKNISKMFLPSLIIAIAGILSSFYFSFLVDNIKTERDVSALIKVFFLVVLLFSVKGGLEVYRNYIMLRLNQELDRSLILKSYYHMLHLPIDFYENRKTGDITSRFTDASKIREALSSAVLTLMIDVILAIGGGVVLFLQDKILFLIVLITASIYAFSVSKFNRFLRNANKQQLECNGEFVSFLTESLIGYETVKVSQFEKKAESKLKKKHNDLLNSVFKVGMVNSSQQFTTELILKIGEAAIVSFGILRVISGTLTLGNLIAFNSLIIYFFEPVKNLICLQPMMQYSIVAFERLNDILDVPCENTQSNVELPNLKKNITINNLFFSYSEDKPALNGISLKIKAGERVAFVGESGCGKTTIAKLLLKLYNKDAGEIFIGNNSIEDISMNFLRNRICFVSQNTFLFNDTILNNITLYNNDDSSSKAIEKICKICKLDELIASLPLGYNTLLEENGMNLSSGQRQRISIARALFRNPDVLILDEATSNLDASTEYDVTYSIEKNYPNVTTIIIAHRLNTIVNCDKIFYISNGTVSECGTHNELISKQGDYYRMWNKQHN